MQDFEDESEQYTDPNDSEDRYIAGLGCGCLFVVILVAFVGYILHSCFQIF